MTQKTALATPDDDGTNEGGAKAKKDRARKRSMHNKELGRKGEEAAARYLTARGYDIVDRNWTCSFGEADIVARDGETVVFVEVKTRTGLSNGLPGEAVTKDKRARYEKIACAYLMHSDYVDMPVRFDVIAISILEPNRAMIRHHIDAFGTDW